MLESARLLATTMFSCLVLGKQPCHLRPEKHVTGMPLQNHPCARQL
jgi:hypothetical protein